jgi:hypothetical protein
MSMQNCVAVYIAMAVMIKRTKYDIPNKKQKTSRLLPVISKFSIQCL